MLQDIEIWIKLNKPYDVYFASAGLFPLRATWLLPPKFGGSFPHNKIIFDFHSINEIDDCGFIGLLHYFEDLSMMNLTTTSNTISATAFSTGTTTWHNFTYEHSNDGL